MYHQSPYEDNEEEIIAHMSPAEVKELFKLQGGESYDHATQLPHFRKLLELMSRPEVLPMLQNLIRQPRAEGGAVERMNDYLRQSGRFGDTVPVKMPRAMADLFDMHLNSGRPSINPNTGKREYFLGSLFGGLSKILSPITGAISSVASPIMSKISQFAAPAINAIGNTLGAPGTGEALTNTLMGVANAAQNAQSGGNFDVGSFGKNALSSAVQSFAPIAAQGAQAGLSALGAESGNPELGEMAGGIAGQMLNQYAPQAAQAYASGQEMPSAGRAFSTAAGQQLSNSGEQNAFTKGASEMLNRYGSGSTPQDAFRGGIYHGINNMENPAAKLGAQTLYNAQQSYEPGAGVGNALAKGFSQVDPNQIHNAINYGVNRLQNAVAQRRTDRFAPTYDDMS